MVGDRLRDVLKGRVELDVGFLELNVNRAEENCRRQ